MAVSREHSAQKYVVKCHYLISPHYQDHKKHSSLSVVWLSKQLHKCVIVFFFINQNTDSHFQEICLHKRPLMWLNEIIVFHILPQSVL